MIGVTFLLAGVKETPAAFQTGKADNKKREEPGKGFFSLLK